MQQETPDELVGGDLHVPGFVTIAGTVVFVIERNVAVVYGAQQLIGDSHSMV